METKENKNPLKLSTSEITGNSNGTKTSKPKTKAQINSKKSEIKLIPEEDILTAHSASAIQNDNNLKENVSEKCNISCASEKNDTKSKIICDALCGIIMLLSIGAYILIGLLQSIWHPTWTIIIAGVVLCAGIGIIGNIFSTKKFNKLKVIGDTICGLIMLGSIVSFLLIGALRNAWHPAWVVLVIGALICGVIGIIISTALKFHVLNKNNK